MTLIARALPLGAIALLVGCGANATSTEFALSPLGEEGRKIANTNGCSACHGRDGQGVNAPGFLGVFGSEVTLDDGMVVVADEAYLIESVVDPGAKQVDGYRIPMPTNNLSDDEVAAVVAYIIDLADEEPPG